MSPLGHLVLILLAWTLCQALPRRFHIAVLSCLGLTGVAIFSPVAAGVILSTVVEAALMVLWWTKADRKSPWRKYGCYLLLPNLLIVDLHEMILGMPIVMLAVSFSVIRIFMTARQLLSSRKALHRPDVVWIFVAAFFLPAVVIGPVFSGIDLQKQHRDPNFVRPRLRDCRMVLQGLILSILASPGFGEMADGAGFFALTGVFLFLQLFAAFWGQSLVAEHTSRFFGYRLPVNFDCPWKARDIHDFWQRWHRSMAQFVLQYIFLPLNLRGMSPRLATIAAFVFMGLWHNLSIGYLVWGLSHGVLLAYMPRVGTGRVARLASRALLWFCVISLSWFANYGPVS